MRSTFLSLVLLLSLSGCLARLETEPEVIMAEKRRIVGRMIIDRAELELERLEEKRGEILFLIEAVSTDLECEWWRSDSETDPRELYRF